MRNLTTYAPKAIAMLCSAGITALTLYVHAADRTQLGAPAAAPSPVLAQSATDGPSTRPDIATVAASLVAGHSE